MNVWVNITLCVSCILLAGIGIWYFLNYTNNKSNQKHKFTITTTPPSFGHDMLSQFMLDATYTNMNFGSFGCLPKHVRDAQQAYTNQMEARPDVWFRGGYQSILNNVRETLARQTNADSVNNLVLVENTSFGVNSVIRSLFTMTPSKPGDIVLYLNEAYGMIKNILRWLTTKDPNLRVLQVDIAFPLAQGNDSDFLVPVEQALRQRGNGSRIRLAIFSHISSAPAIILPVDKLATLCKSHNVECVLIDGAHALGQIPIDLTYLANKGVDFYVANAHKWLYGPKGSAMMWIATRFHSKFQIVPAVIGSKEKWDIPGVFEYTGERDYTALCSIRDAIAFRQWIGGDVKIMNYIHELAWSGAELLIRKWKTKSMAPKTMTAGMVDVQLPSTASEDKLKTLNQRMLTQYGLYIPVYRYPDRPGGAYWTRVSAQIFLELSDFIKMGDYVMELLR